LLLDFELTIHGEVHSHFYSFSVFLSLSSSVSNGSNILLVPQTRRAHHSLRLDFLAQLFVSRQKVEEENKL